MAENVTITHGVSAERLAHLERNPTHVNPIYELPAIVRLALQSLDREGVTMETAHQYLLSNLPPTIRGDYAKRALEHAIKAVRDALDERGGAHA